MTGDLVVQRGLKCDMDKPVWGLSGTTDTYKDLPGVVDLRCRPGSKGSSCTGRKAENKAEGCCSLHCRPESLQQRHWQLSARRGQRHCRSPTGTGGKWAQLSSMPMRAQGGQVRLGQRRVRCRAAGRIRSLKKNGSNQQSDALATMTEDGGSWTVGGGSWSSRVASLVGTG